MTIRAVAILALLATPILQAGHRRPYTPTVILMLTIGEMLLWYCFHD